MDNIIDITTYPLKEQEKEAKNKRRMGLGVTGIANAGEILGYPYGSEEYLKFQDKVLRILRDSCYRESIELAKEKGPFPLFDRDKYLQSNFVKRLPKDIQEGIKEHGIRNSHLTSIAPTGTISLCADNVSSGIEPPYLLETARTVKNFEGETIEVLKDYAYEFHGVKGKTAMECSAEEHVNVLIRAAKYVDSAVSKTCNVSDDVTFSEFKELYVKAWKGGAKGITTFRPNGKRYGILNEVSKETVEDSNQAEACFIDFETGKKTCE